MVSFGYVDICIAQYTMTELRSLTLEWMLMESDGLYLFIMNQYRVVRLPPSPPQHHTFVSILNCPAQAASVISQVKCKVGLE
jgi:hypothetical protein